MGMDVDGLLGRLTVKGEGEWFLSFGNADGKRWLMPERGMRTAMMLYQPSGQKGKMVSRWLPLLHRSAAVRRTLRAERLRLRLADGLRSVLEDAFGCSGLDFSIFCGTPSVHQKITMQISRGGRPLGYCKATANADVASLFDSEAAVLRSLAEAGFEGAPRCLYCGRADDGVALFVQTTEKTRRSRVEHRWTPLHDDFLLRLHQATSRRVAYDGSDFAASMASLRAHVDWLPTPAARSLVVSAIERAEEPMRGKELEMSACHADFTPWNMFVEQGRLFAFDWEYARLTYPPGLDRYHFFTQTAIFEGRMGAEEIASALPAWTDFDDYRLYLLDTLSRFTVREGRPAQGAAARQLLLWCGILNRLP